MMIAIHVLSFFQGRRGLGNIYVWATGNGGMHGDDCNADGYTSSVETLSVGSITDWGRQPFYMENCSSTLAVVPTGGEEYQGQEEDMGQIKLKVVSGSCFRLHGSFPLLLTLLALTVEKHCTLH